MPHIEKRRRSGQTVWRARYRAPDGRERSRSFTRKVDAEAFLVTVETTKLRGEWRDPVLGRTRFGDFADHVEATRLNRRSTTRARDAALMRKRVLPAFESRPLASITSTDVKAWVASLEAAGLAPTTIRICCQLLARVLAEAVDAGLIATSPCRRIALPGNVRREPGLLTPDHVARLASVIEARYRALVMTAAYTGLRWGELAGLRVGRIDFLRRRIDVAEILVEVDGDLSFGPPKTATSRARVSFPPFLGDQLGFHIGTYADPEPERALVFTSDEGSPLRRSNFRRRVWLPALDAGGLPSRTRFHDLRHACASWLIHAGANPLEVAAKLRHARVTTTLATYGHLFPGTDDRLDALLADAFASTDTSVSADPPAAPPRPNRGPTGSVTRISGAQGAADLHVR